MRRTGNAGAARRPTGYQTGYLCTDNSRQRFNRRGQRRVNFQ